MQIIVFMIYVKLLFKKFGTYKLILSRYLIVNIILKT